MTTPKINHDEPRYDTELLVSQEKEWSQVDEWKKSNDYPRLIHYLVMHSRTYAHLKTTSRANKFQKLEDRSRLLYP